MAVCHIKINHTSRRCCELCSLLRRRRHQRWIKNLQNWIKFQHSWTLLFNAAEQKTWKNTFIGSLKYSNVSLSLWVNEVTQDFRIISIFCRSRDFCVSLLFTPSKVRIYSDMFFNNIECKLIFNIFVLSLIQIICQENGAGSCYSKAPVVGDFKF